MKIIQAVAKKKRREFVALSNPDIKLISYLSEVQKSPVIAIDFVDGTNRVDMLMTYKQARELIALLSERCDELKNHVELFNRGIE